VFPIPELFNLKNSLIISTEITPLTSIILHSPIPDLIIKPDEMTVINRKKGKNSPMKHNSENLGFTQCLKRNPVVCVHECKV
jgi:hypothetical protein